MQNDFLLNIPVGLLPVIVFLVILDHFDDHNLIRYYHINITMVGGGLLAVAAYFINSEALYTLQFDYKTYTRFGGPFVEECLKGGLMVYLFRTHRIGFSIDAAIRGFAIGAGFAVVENIYYLYNAVDAHLGIWVIRGLGTAIMHGGVTAIFGVIAQQMTNRHARLNPALYLPGLFAAITLHSIFNHFPGSPVLSTMGALIGLITILSLLFSSDTLDIHETLTQDLDVHEKWLGLLGHETFHETQHGDFLKELNETFLDYKIGEMHAYLMLHTELVIISERRLLAWQDGDIAPVGQDIRNSFNEMDNLIRDLGPEALEALHGHMDFRRQERWKLYMLKSRADHETLASDTSLKWVPPKASEDTDDKPKS